MPNEALQQFLKTSEWFPAFAQTHGFGDLDEAINYYAVNAPGYWGSISAGGGVISNDPANTASMGTSDPQGLGGFVDTAIEAASQPQNIGTAIGMVSGIPGGSMIGNPAGAAIGDLAFGQPVDTANLGMFGALGVGALRSVFGAIPSDMFSPPDLQSAHPDIGPQPGFRSPEAPAPGDPGDPGIGGLGSSGQFSGPGAGNVDARDSSGAGGSYGGEGAGRPGAPGNPSGAVEGLEAGGYGGEGSAGSGSGGGNEGHTGEGANGDRYRGGIIRRDTLRSFARGGSVGRGLRGNPAGPDDGYAALDIGEFVMPEHAVRWHGLKKMMSMLKEAEANEDRGESLRRERAEDRGFYRGGLFSKRRAGYSRGFRA